MAVTQNVLQAFLWFWYLQWGVYWWIFGLPLWLLAVIIYFKKMRDIDLKYIRQIVLKRINYEKSTYLFVSTNPKRKDMLGHVFKPHIIKPWQQKWQQRLSEWLSIPIYIASVSGLGIIFSLDKAGHWVATGMIVSFSAYLFFFFCIMWAAHYFNGVFWVLYHEQKKLAKRLKPI